MGSCTHRWLLQLGLLALLPGAVLSQTPAPRLFFSDLVTGPNSGGQGNNGAFVTLYGNYFGSNPTVTVGGGQAIVTMSPSSCLWYQKMTIQLGALTQTGNIVVSNSNGTSNGLPFTVNSSSIYFVATNGNDSAAGSYAAPWQTLVHAVQTAGASAGSIIYAMDGVSQTADDGQGWGAAITLRTAWCQGTSASPTALIAYPGATVTVGTTTETAPAYGIRGTDSSADDGACGGNWVIAGLYLRGIQPIQTAGPSTNWRIIGNDVSNPQNPGGDGGGSALGVMQSTYTHILGNNGHDLNVNTTDRLQQGFYPGTDSNYLELAWNMIENVGGRSGIQIHSSPLSAGNGYAMYAISIHDNVVHDIAEEGIIVDTVDPSKGPVTVYNNVVYNTGKDGESDGAIYRADSSDYDTSQGVGSGYVDFYNNTIFAYTNAGPGFGNSFEVDDGQALIDRLRNNIILSSGGDYFDVTNSTSDEACSSTDNASACPNFVGSNNILYGAGAATFTNLILASINANPMLVNAATGDAHLQAASPAIAAGVTISGLATDIQGMLRPASGAPDIGAYQYGSASATPAAGLRFVPITSCRVADTRNPAGPFGGPAMEAGSTRSFPIPQSACGIPATAQAYSLNVTVVPNGRLSYLTLFPTGQNQPLVSTLNSYDGAVVANAAIVPAGTDGAVSVYVTDPTQVILDIDGYFDSADGPNSYSFYTVQPCRVADTRNPAGALGGPSLFANQSRDFPLPSSSCGLPPTASAYSLNVTVVPGGFLGYLATWATGQAQPPVSTLNSWSGTVVANAAIVPAGANGSISVFATNPTDVILDANGYFAAPGSQGALSFYPVTPCRVADTRNATGPFGGPELEAATARSFVIPASGCNIPSTAAAYSVNVTVVPDGPLSYLTVWPTGSPQPPVSTLNSYDGSVVANAAIVPAGTNGAISVFVTDPTHVILDINGYFAP